MRSKATLPAVTATFVPFALLLSAALLAAEPSHALDHARLLYSSWVSLVFATFALCLFAFPKTRDGDLELLTWTFAFGAYLVHFWYAFGLLYHASLAETYKGQGALIATSNFALTALWAVDVAAGWMATRDVSWHRVLRWVARVWVLVTFVASAVLIFGGFVRVLGIAMMVAVVACVVVRVAEMVGGRRRARGEYRALEAGVDRRADDGRLATRG
ncbi:MAG: hypothetical protein JOZ69_06685 [Myxococcales bacterium]|nr:hypothetical protein [Myxococcales bacterium]